MLKTGKAGQRMALLVIGTIITSLGTSLSMGAGFGSGTLAVLWQGLGLKLNLSMGAASLLLSLVFICVVLVLNPRQLHVGTVIHQFVYSLFLDLFDRISFRTGVMAADLFFMVAGVVITSVGIGLYASADMGKGPYEAVCFSLQQRKGWKLGVIRMVADAVMVAVGLAMGGTVGLCTVALLLISGPVIQKTVELLDGLTWFRHTFARQ